VTNQAGPYFDLQVERVIDETHDARSFVLTIPQELEATFAYRAGQFLTFGVPLGDHHLVRCYSLASCPETESQHKVTVKRIDDGRVSNWFNENVEAGHTLHVMKPAGHFCLADRETPLVFFGAGSGITPIASLIKTALATTERRLHLVYANRDADSVIFSTELRALAARYPDRFELTHRLDDVDGFLDVPAAQKVVAADPGADFYICGPGVFMDVVEAALAEASVAQEQVFIERFVTPDLDAAAAAPATGQAMDALRVYLDGEVHEVPVQENETILAACHRAGIDAPCACTEGYCGACMAQVKQGKVEMLLNDGGLDDDQVEEGWVLTCQTRVCSAGVQVDYPDAD